MPNKPGLPPGLEKHDELPPGLQNHLDENGTLPPGLDKRVADIDVFVGNSGSPNQILINDGSGELAALAASQPPTPAPFPTSSDVAFGDLDGDGDLDVFVTTTGFSNHVLLNDGTGAFSFGPPPPAPATSAGVALGDLDGDGDLDAFIANAGLPANQANQVLINDGSGTFTAPAASQPPGLDFSTDVALGDLDGDGDLDAFVTNSNGNQVLLNNGTGTFTAGSPGPTTSGASSAVALGDLDGDGDLDAFVAKVGTNQVLINDGTGAFTATASQPPGSVNSQDVALGDLDGDGDLDAFVVNAGLPAQPNQVLINDGTGTFTAPVGSQPPGAVQSVGVALGDIDGDGDLDAFIANGGSGAPPNELLLGNGDGTFTLAASQPTGVASSQAIALGDLDGDGNVPAVDAVGLPNINPDGLLPDLIV